LEQKKTHRERKQLFWKLFEGTTRENINPYL
jgi:hypothetical protein